MITVSIIIATYNTAEFIKECVESVISQSIREKEIIIIDDGSTDNTYEILKPYIIDGMVNYYYQENQGAGIARNFAIDIAKGEYLAFMDPDDFYPNLDCLEKMYTVCKENNMDICGGAMVAMDYDGKTVVRYSAGEGLIHGKKNIVVDIDDYDCLYGHTRFLYNSELIKANNVYYASYKRFEDQVFTMKALGIARKFYELDYPVYTHRRRRGHFSQNEKIFIDIMQGIRDTINILYEYRLDRILTNNYNSLMNQYMLDILKYSHNEKLCQVLDDIECVIENYNTNKKMYVNKSDINSNVLRLKYIQKMISDIVSTKQDVYIFGAGNNTKVFLKNACGFKDCIKGIVVSSLEGNPVSLDEIPVIPLRDFLELDKKLKLIITIDRKYKNEVEDLITNNGISDYLFIDARYSELYFST